MEFEGQTIADAMANLSGGTRAWLNWINVIALGGLFFIRMKEARVLVGAFVLSMPMGIWLFTKVGLEHPLSGLSHVVFWLPAILVAVYWIRRDGLRSYQGWYRKAGLLWTGLVVATFAISNVFDVFNLLRFLILDDPGPRV